MIDRQMIEIITMNWYNKFKFWCNGYLWKVRGTGRYIICLHLLELGGYMRFP